MLHEPGSAPPQQVTHKPGVSLWAGILSGTPKEMFSLEFRSLKGDGQRGGGTARQDVADVPALTGCVHGA